ncbi:hypothetical protein BDZ91DRAFT_733508 [Kalaharituber pfeilii]|nr:hypothetical protein BDZ91DRAFT_733508 [Kalaharituber pfeilii]
MAEQEKLDPVCPFCPFRFSDLAAHLDALHPACIRCHPTTPAQRFRDVAALQQHFNVWHKGASRKKKSLVCQVPGCQRKFKTLLALGNHSVDKHRGTMKASPASYTEFRSSVPNVGKGADVGGPAVDACGETESPRSGVTESPRSGEPESPPSGETETAQFGETESARCGESGGSDLHTPPDDLDEKHMTAEDMIALAESQLAGLSLTSPEPPTARNVTNTIRPPKPRAHSKFRCDDCNRNFPFMGALTMHMHHVHKLYIGKKQRKKCKGMVAAGGYIETQNGVVSLGPSYPWQFQPWRKRRGHKRSAGAKN